MIVRRKWAWIGHTLRKPATETTTKQALKWNPRGTKGVSLVTEGGLLGFSDQCQHIKHAMFSLRRTTISGDFIGVITDLIHINEIILTKERWEDQPKLGEGQLQKS